MSQQGVLVLSERVLISGAKGFIGSNLLNATKLRFELIDTLEEDSVSDWNFNINVVKKLQAFKPTVIFHVGASSDTLNHDVQYMMLRNYFSSVVLTDWASENKCKLIYSSSAAVYGTNELYPSNLYGWSKYAAENYVIAKGGIALRYFNVYGPGEEQKGEMASFFYQAYISRSNNRQVLLFPGFPKRDFVYVKDVVSANIHALDHYMNLCGKWYEVGTGIASTFERVLDLGGIPYQYSDASVVPAGYQYQTCSMSKKWMKGWTPKFQIEQGIEDYLKYLSEDR